MQMKAICTVAVIALCLLPSSLFSVSTKLHLRIESLKIAEAPFRFESSVIFTFTPASKPVRYVGALFSSDKYAKIHVFSKNDYNVYFYILPISRKISRLEYKFVQDGVWMTDPHNPKMEGGDMSVYSLEGANHDLQSNPFVNQRQRDVTFRFYSTDAHRIYLVSDLNYWNFFSFQLQKDPRHVGVFSVTLYNVKPGKHYYYFIVDNKKTIDPLNSTTVISPATQRPASFFEVQ